MNSEDVLIDELDKALLGPETPPRHCTTLCGAICEAQGGGGMFDCRARCYWGKRGYVEEGFDESSSGGSSPLR